MAPRPTSFIFGALAVVFLGLTLVWLGLDHSPPAWDDASYLANSLSLVDALAEGGLPCYARTFLTVMDNKPPLIAALPTPVYLIAGRHSRAAYMVNLASMLGLFAAVFRIARRRSTARAGLLAVYVVATMPMVYGLSRWYLVECTLIALVALTICILWESNHLADTRKVLVLGLLCGMGLLLKFTFPLYVLVPFSDYALRTPRTAWRPRTLLVFALPVVALALPWYFLHFRVALATAIDSGSVDAAVQSVGSQVYSLAVMRAYLTRLFNAGPSLYFAVLPVLLISVFGKLSPGARDALRLCALWASPILFLLIWRSREVRYAAPLFPALAVALAVPIDTALSRFGKWSRVGCGALLALPLISMIQVSFGLFGEWRLELGGLLFNPQRLVYAGKYDRRPWPYREILEDLHQKARSSDRQEESLLVGSDSSHFNADSFRLAAAERKLPFRVMTTAYEKSWNTIPPLLDWATFFIYEEGGERRSIYFNVHGMAALKEVRESGKFVELPLSRKLPDGGVVRVFENRSHNGLVRTGAFLPSGMQTIPDGDATFGGVLRIDGLGFRQADGAVEVKYRWRCLQPVDREYWCFTHLLDSQGKVVAYLDHRILNANPPMTVWKPGDLAVESVSLRSPAIQVDQTYSLRFGLYDRASGQRLPISSGSLPVTDDRTAAVVQGPR